MGSYPGRETVAKKKSDFGTLYKGHEGQWTWIAHRVTGVAIILFLFAHVVDTAVIGWGPEAYNKVLAAYANPVVRFLEYGLVTAVLYHALNGVRIMIVDFWPSAALHQKQLFYATMTIFVLAMIPISWIMIKGAVALI